MEIFICFLTSLLLQSLYLQFYGAREVCLCECLAVGEARLTGGLISHKQSKNER